MLTDPKNANLLIVDDLPENLLALEALIRQDDRTVYQASSGEAALALLLEHDFAMAILDVQMPGMNGFELAELMRGTDKTRHIPIVFVSAAGKELNYAFKGYETGAVDFLYKPLDIDAVKGKVNVFVELYHHRNEVRRQVLALEQSRREQEVLLQQLQTAQGELQAAVRSRDDFLSLVGHELLTPLNTLFLETQLRKTELDRGNAAIFNEAYLQEMVGRDQRQIQNMITLIDDMRDVSRIRSGKLSIRSRPAELSALLHRAVAHVQAQAEADGTTLTLVAPQPVHGQLDEFRVEQVVVNLLTNALRHGKGKQVTVRLAQLPDGARIEVQDQGPGVKPGDEQRIFEQFERGEKGTGGARGLGLGLYISKQLVEAHGGRISLHSKPGDGTVFTVMLPLVPPAEVASRAAA